MIITEKINTNIFRFKFKILQYQKFFKKIVFTIEIKITYTKRGN